MQQSDAAQTEVESQWLHDAFISYSRKNEAFADCLEKALASYSPPKGLAAPQRRLQIFRDKLDFTGTEYHRSLEKHLTDSARLIVICSPEAYQSEYVNDEIRQFARLRGTNGIIPVLSSGIPNNEVKPGEEAQRAFPAALCELMAMPLAADFRGFTPRKNKVNGGLYRDAWYTTLANIYDLPRAEIEERDRKRRQRTHRITLTVTTVIVCLIAVAVTIAWRSRLQAQKEARDAAQLQYIGNIVRAQQAYEATDLPGMRRLLQAVAPASSDSADDFRGFEWYYLWRLSQGPSSTIVANNSTAKTVAFSPDGKLFVTGDEDGTVQLWSTGSRKELGHLPGQGGAVKSLAFSPDGKILATAAANAYVKLWDVSSRTLAAEIKDLGNSVEGVAFSHAAPVLAAVGWEPPSKIARFWDLKSQRVVAVLTGDGTASASNMFVALSPDGSVLALSSGYGVKLCRFPSGEKIAEFGGTGMYAYVSAVAFSPDGKTLVVADIEGKVQFYDVAQRRKSGTLAAHQDYISSLVFSSDGGSLITASADKTLKLWDARSRAARIEWKGHTGPVDAIAISTDGRTVVSVAQDKTVRLWDASERSEYEENTDPNIQSVSPSPYDDRLALTNAETVAIWDSSGRKELVRISSPSLSEAGDIAFSPDHKTIAIVSGKSIELWDTSTSSRPVETLEVHTKQVNGAAFSPDGKWLALGSEDHTVRVWNMSAHRTPPVSLSSHTKGVTDVAFSPDSKILATGSDDGTVKLWDVGSWREIASSVAFTTPLPGAAETDQHLLTALSFSPDGELLAAAGADGTAMVWRVTSRTLQKAGPLVGHTGAINALAFSPDSRTIATASSDTTVKLWRASLLRELLTIKEPKSGKEVPHFLEGSENQVVAVAFSSDGKLLITGMNDGAVRFRRAAKESEIASDRQK